MPEIEHVDRRSILWRSNLGHRCGLRAKESSGQRRDWFPVFQSCALRCSGVSSRSSLREGGPGKSCRRLLKRLSLREFSWKSLGESFRQAARQSSIQPRRESQICVLEQIWLSTLLRFWVGHWWGISFGLNAGSWSLCSTATFQRSFATRAQAQVGSADRCSRPWRSKVDRLG